jgi:hypothetical protein
MKEVMSNNQYMTLRLWWIEAMWKEVAISFLRRRVVIREAE